MNQITSLAEFRQAMVQSKLDQMLGEFLYLLTELGYVLDKNMQPKYILQGFHSPPIPGIVNLNNYCYDVDNKLVQEGWNTFGYLPIDENYFTTREQYLKGFEGRLIKEVRGNYYKNNPCTVFYFKGVKK